VRDGAAALLMGRRLERLQEARRSIVREVPDARVELFAGDALLGADLQRAALSAFDIHGTLDIVIPTLGGTTPRPILMHEAETIRDDLALNLGSAILAVRHTAPFLARSGGGSIVFISSEAAKLSMPWLSSYAAAKAGLEAFVRSAADELASLKIRVNAVRPGTTRTEATQVLFDSPELYEPLASGRPLGRLGEPDDIAGGVRYLAGPESSWVTGQSLAIDGGGELRQAPDLRSLVEAIYGKEDFAEVLAGRAPADTRSDDRARKR
jgi:NAD(P)-dependent dehydrogenase (short-subunit alcohol dehydrogenase family)